MDFFKPEKVRSNKWDCTSLGFVCKVNQCLLFYCNVVLCYVRHNNTKFGLLMFATILIIITNSFDNFLTISPTLTGDNASAWLDHDHVSWVSPFYSVWASLRSHFRPTPCTYEPLLVLQALKLFSLVEKFSVQLFWAEVSCVRLSMLYRVYTQQMSFCIMTKWYVI